LSRLREACITIRVPIPVTTLGEAFATAAGRWPGLRVAEQAWLDYLAARDLLTRPAEPPLIEDMFLACACSLGVAGAIELFDKRFQPLIEQVARSFDPAPHFCDEVKQELHRTLFVSAKLGAPRIAQFTGRGPLSAWIVTATKRLALRLKKGTSQRRHADDELLAEQLSPERDAEWLWLSGRYREVLERALSNAIRQLSERDRMILRMHTVRGLSMASIARMHGVSQPTVSRWMRDAREEVLRSVLAAVCEECNCNHRELESIVRLVQSQLELNMSALSEEG
jgi:RNA polymerase sigma-70 factor, ECF subfamily